MRPLVPLLLAAMLALPAARPAQAVSDPAEMLPNPAQEERAREIGRELRCLVCQNQSIEDSDAGIARDLRRLVREQVAAGRASDEVIAFVHDRYGDFVLLRPRFTLATALLWATPALAIGLGLLLARGLRRRRAAPAAPAGLSAEEQARLRQLAGEPPA